MNYLDVRLSPDDNWVNRYTDVKMPNDANVRDKDKLAQLSGPVITYYLNGDEQICQRNLQSGKLCTASTGIVS